MGTNTDQRPYKEARVVHGLRVIQTNLGREKIAHDLAITTATGKGADILIFAKLNIPKARHKARGDVGVFFLNRRLTLCQVVSRNGFLGIRCGGYCRNLEGGTSS